MAPVKFDKKEAGYKAWIEANPDGYVLNAKRNQTSKYVMLHTAKCPHIASFVRMEPGAYTEGRYIKLGSGSISDLKVWSKKERPNAPEVLICRTCNPE